MRLNPCYVCKTPIPELKMDDGKYAFHCTKCGCSTKYKDLFDAEKDWNDGITYPVECSECVHGNGTWEPCGKQFHKTFAVLCGHFERRQEHGN